MQMNILQSETKQYSCVVDWLERIAAERIEHHENEHVVWQRTHNAIVHRLGNDLIEKLDPDAPLRERSKKLASNDEDDEIELLNSLWMVRLYSLVFIDKIKE